jgi:hypothetical protein
MNEDVVELHPLAKLAFTALTPSGPTSFTITDHAKERIVAGLERLFDKPDLRSAVVSLISLAKHVEDTGSVAAADALISIAATACSALKKQGSQSKRLAEDIGMLTTATFAAFSDRSRDVARAAPKQTLRSKFAPNEGLTIASMNAAKRRIIR